MPWLGSSDSVQMWHRDEKCFPVLIGHTTKKYLPLNYDTFQKYARDVTVHAHTKITF